jgi:hypothetical protein
VNWEEKVVSCTSYLPFSGVPFVVIGRQLLECSSGPNRAASRQHPTSQVWMGTQLDSVVVYYIYFHNHFQIHVYDFLECRNVDEHESLLWLFIWISQGRPVLQTESSLSAHQAATPW